MMDASRRYDGWPRVGASAAIFRDRDILLIQRGKGAYSGLWSLPGGHVEPGETVSAAAAREVAEETGVTARILGLVDVHDVIHRDAGGSLSAHYVLAVHYGAWLAGEAVAASDARAAQFFPLDGLAALPMTPEAKDLIAQASGLFRGASGT